MHLFLAKQGNKLLNYLLAILLFSKFGQVFISLLIHSEQQQLFPNLYQFFTPFWYISPACFYLYTTSFIHENSRLSKVQWLHLVPAVFAIVHVFPWGQNTTTNWSSVAIQIEGKKQLFITESTGLFSAAFYYLGKPALTIIYLILTWYVVLKSKIFHTDQNCPRKKWLLFFLMVGTFFQLISFLPLLFWNMSQPDISRSFMLMSGVVFLSIMIFIFHHPKLLYGYLFVSVSLDTVIPVRKETAEAKINEELEIEREEKVKTAKPETIQLKKISLLPDQLLQYSNAMREVMDIEKPYLMEDFQIIDLAGKLNIPVHHCSFILNNLVGKNFREWINEYRIQFFMDQYPIKAERMKIGSIARECGFKSTATFYNAFKKETGLMPTVYFAQKKVS
ncbi:hypothetical protein AQ505_11870 [Pedobacter sp. PACM 27299]|uniref:helix-turn-helix domain-containing protein n=1 Tax=Pedobacter sp. PACM 27299 TaxID=1727164 RepID=UPI0007068A2E|nr:helix-turn-helix domain-containing protein [Pedobacter sp. PACM 27299]ALL06128.1 hypothetical protein AQ505_11870 [Pedobacter sp. PACM 27299]